MNSEAKGSPIPYFGTKFFKNRRKRLNRLYRGGPRNVAEYKARKESLVGA